MSLLSVLHLYIVSMQHLYTLSIQHLYIFSVLYLCIFSVLNIYVLSAVCTTPVYLFCTTPIYLVCTTPIYLVCCLNNTCILSALHLCIEGSRPEWCISSMIYSGDIPFRSEILDISCLMFDLHLSLVCTTPIYRVCCLCYTYISCVLSIVHFYILYVLHLYTIRPREIIICLLGYHLSMLNYNPPILEYRLW